jgi:CDP-6-deoxy-D-xylo-4-hexulose-3-dehydrase
MRYIISTVREGATSKSALEKGLLFARRLGLTPMASDVSEDWRSLGICLISLMVNSGSSANLLCIAALFYKKNRPLQRGDEVVVPAISWATTYHPLQQYGLKLKIVDVELDR